MKRFKNILYIYEGSVGQDQTIASAVSLAQKNQARLTVVDVVPVVSAGIGLPPGGPISKDLQEVMVEKCRDELEAFISPYKELLKIHIDVLVGVKFIEAIRAVLKNGYDLIIKAAENPTYIERLFGSEDMHLLRKCPCPVWLMKAGETSNYDCIVAAVGIAIDETDIDDQKLNRDILEIASSMAIADSSTLHLVHAWDAPQAGFASLWTGDQYATEKSILQGTQQLHEIEMNKLVGQLRDHIGSDAFNYISPQMHLHKGEPKKVIPEFVRSVKADLVVMGTVARTGMPGFIIGNTAEAILDQLQCSVLAIKPAGFVSPVK